jgi:hypothetical protein
MENAQETDGFPVPEWSMRGTQEQVTERLGNGFEFLTYGWYVELDRAVLILPPSLDYDEGEMLGRLLYSLFEAPVATDQAWSHEECLCYSWSTDPRPAIAAMVLLEDRTEVAVSAVLVAAWPAIVPLAEELRAWCQAEIWSMAMQQGAEMASIPQVPSIGPLPAVMTKEHVVVMEGGATAYRFGTYVVCVMSIGQYRAMIKRLLARDRMPAYLRNTEVPGFESVGITLRLHTGT